MKEIILKLYKMFNEIFDKQIKDYLDTAENNKKVPKESYIFLESAKKSINNCLSLIENDEYDLYAIICLLDISLVDNYDNVNSLLKKYKDYLYLSTTRKYLNRNNNKKLINELKSEIKKVDNVDKFNENLREYIDSIILKFDSLDIYNKYFEKPS